VQGVTEEPLEPVYPVGNIFKLQIQLQRLFWGNIMMLNGASFFHTAKKGKLTIYRALMYNINHGV
jgi:hypothetical protein